MSSAMMPDRDQVKDEPPTKEINNRESPSEPTNDDHAVDESTTSESKDSPAGPSDALASQENRPNANDKPARTIRFAKDPKPDRTEASNENVAPNRQDSVSAKKQKKHDSDRTIDTVLQEAESAGTNPVAMSDGTMQPPPTRYLSALTAALVEDSTSTSENPVVTAPAPARNFPMLNPARAVETPPDASRRNPEVNLATWEIERADLRQTDGVHPSEFPQGEDGLDLDGIELGELALARYASAGLQTNEQAAAIQSWADGAAPSVEHIEKAPPAIDELEDQPSRRRGLCRGCIMC